MPVQTCIACRSNDVEILSAVPDVHAGTEKFYDLNVCRLCGSWTLAQNLSPSDLETIYPPNFYSYVGQTSNGKAVDALMGLLYNRHRFRPRFNKMLEIGSGRGDFIASLGAQDRAIGLERSASAKSAGEAIGVNIVVGAVEDPALFPPGSFDYIYSNHALEHLSAPDEALASMKRWLAPGGHVFIGIPNAGGAVARLFTKFWYHTAVPLHVALYTPRGVTALLERNGFVVEKITYNSDPFSIPMSVAIAMGKRPPNLTRTEKLAARIAALVIFPISKLLDWTGRGDCMEIHARIR